MIQSTQRYDERGRKILPMVASNGTYLLDESGRVKVGPRPTSFPRNPRTGKMSFGTKIKWLLLLGVDWKAPFQY